MRRVGDNVIPFPVGGRPPAHRDRPTFRDLADEWLRAEAGRLACPDNERRHIAHLRPLWELTEEGLRPRRVKEVLASLLRPHGSLGAATVNKIQATGRRIIREALLNEEWSGPNPFEVVRRLRQERPIFRTLGLTEVRQLLPHLRPDRRREALAMLYLGLRPGELKALRKCDLDLARGELVIRRSNDRDQTKTGKVRRLPIPDGLRPVIAEALSSSPATCEVVFAGVDGGRQRFDVKLARMLHDALRRAGLVTGYRYVCRRKGCGHREERGTLEAARCPECGFKLLAIGIPLAVRYYDLRHSAATLHREAGCDPLVIQLALGHAAENLTDSIYTHLSPDYVRRELNKLVILWAEERLST